MMFVLRGIAVSLTFFVLLYGLLSLLVVCVWRGVTLWRGTSAPGPANLLFWLRVFPLLTCALITVLFAVPSFVIFEPRSIEEDMGLPLALGLGCLLLFALGSFRVVAAQKRTARVAADWLKGAHALDAGVATPTFRAEGSTPPLALVGVCSPRVVVSRTTVALLSADELRVAVRHEVAHIRSRDNLKKLVFHCSPFPGMASLESAWQEAAEIAADDGAVASVRDALDLATALIKLSRLIPLRATPAFTMALMSGSGSVRGRVERLLAWNDLQPHPVPTRWHYAIPPVLAAVLCTAAVYGPALAQTHRITEWLVR
jgi:Zn-dependent protease with chaperone function